ncbi:hypothetical protein [Nonomuraea aurantiaca]|uniref:hypothetical protein n=1 Tax=Nonomuraea aurantiaca TaxID=2878562 RepID=UPI001CD92E73|nr:hypothetical protein [Nonomuraea aurantiaca]MCA2224198.1 hypothetical protein [Nonomuraea aurantiaca]
MSLTVGGGAGFRSGRPETGRRGALPSPPAALWAGASLLLVVTACAAAPRPDEPSVPSVASVADLVLPFDAYKPTPEQRVLLANAQARLVARCMRRHGVSAAPPMVAVAAVRAGDPGNTRRYGVADPAQAALTGYHLSRLDSHARPPQWEANLSKTARTHLYGETADSGCMSRAAAVLTRGAEPADWPWLAVQDAETLEKAATDPAVVQAATRWRACMVKAGYAYPTAEAAIADARWNLDHPRVTAEEKRTATADTRCKWESGLVAAWFAADSALQRKVVAGNPDRFAALRANLGSRLARASKVFQETD